jgi:hypothetical protein
VPYKDREKKNEARRRWRASRSPEQRLLDNARARVRHHRAWQNATDERKAAVRARKRIVTYKWYRERSDEQKARDLESKRRSKAKQKLNLGLDKGLDQLDAFREGGDSLVMPS